MRDDEPLHRINYVDGAPILVQVSGEIDFHAVTDVEAVVRHGIEQRAGDVHVELSGVTFADVSFANALVRLQRDADRGNGKLVLRDAPELVVRLLDHLGLRERFTWR